MNFSREFVPKELAQALREIGYDLPCLGHWSTNGPGFWTWESVEATGTVGAPTWTETLRWFREVKGLHGTVDLQAVRPAHWYFRIDDIASNDYLFHSEDVGSRYSNFDLALHDCVKKLIALSNR